MRNPALHLIGIAASPGGGGVFSSYRAEEELRHWLEQRLDALGIDPVASYSRFVISLLRCPDSALTPSPELLPNSKYSGTATTAAAAVHSFNTRARYQTKLPLHTKREPRRAVVKCLTSAADQKCGVESLVDELCIKLRDLEGSDTKIEQEHSKTATDEEAIPFESLTPRDQALRYYAAFPALQATTSKKLRQKQRKEQNLINNNNLTNNNQNIIKNLNNKKGIGVSSGKNKNNRARQKKNKIFLATETQLRDQIEDLELLNKMQQEREKEQELALDQLRLAQLEAKFDESLEALWNNGSNISQTMDSIWAAPSFSIPSGNLWPSEITDASFPAITSEKTTQYQETLIDDSPLIPLDVDLFDIDDYNDDTDSKAKSNYDNVSWSDSVGDSPFCWGGRRNVAALSHIPCTAGCYSECNTNYVKVDKELNLQKSRLSNNQEQDEDLLTSPRTHFRPIKEDGWADGTTFPINNALERVPFRRSESGNLLYLPGGESPYMEYKEKLYKPIAVSAKLTLKFRVQQCDKGTQTEPVRSPTKRRILSEHQDLFNIRVVGNSSFNLEQGGWDQSMTLIRNERKRRHSSSIKSRPITVLRPLTL